ncbi:MAG TPA: hypothetical protein VGD06_05395 [Acidobacteriota bacterium]
MILIPDQDPRVRELWKALLELAAEHPEGWTLIGAQMVFLHPAWSRLPNAEDARITLKILMDRR